MISVLLLCHNSFSPGLRQKSFPSRVFTRIHRHPSVPPKLIFTTNFAKIHFFPSGSPKSFFARALRAFWRKALLLCSPSGTFARPISLTRRNVLRFRLFRSRENEFWRSAQAKNHLEERLLDQAQARASYTPLFWGRSRSIPQCMVSNV